MDFLTLEGIWTLLKVIGIDLALAGDNAIVIGLAAAGLPARLRARAILVGIMAATVLRILFAVAATHLLAVKGLLLAGGILLLWVCWKMWRELQAGADGSEAAPGAETSTPKTFAQAVMQIVLADVSMSLDNVLAVAGAARETPVMIVFGLGISIAMMGLAANVIARLLNRHRWIAYLGLAVILYVAVTMIWEGGHEVLALLKPA